MTFEVGRIWHLSFMVSYSCMRPGMDVKTFTFPGFCFAVGAFRMACFLGFLAEVPSSSSADSLSVPAALSEFSVSSAGSSTATPAAASSSA